jgi:hypothetical protein
MLEKILDSVNGYWFIAIGASSLLAVFIFEFFSKEISGSYKFGKLTKEQFDYMKAYISRVNNDLDSRKLDGAAYQHKRLTELLDTIGHASKLKRNKDFKAKLVIIEFEAQKCKKRIEESMRAF